MYVVAGPSGSGKTSAFRTSFRDRKASPAIVTAPERICEFLKRVLKITYFLVRWRHVPDDIYIPGRLAHRLSKIDRRRQALYTKMFRESLGSTLSWKYQAEVNIPRSSEIIALFFHSSEYVNIIVIGVIHIILRFHSQPSTG